MNFLVHDGRTASAAINLISSSRARSTSFATHLPYYRDKWYTHKKHQVQWEKGRLKQLKLKKTPNVRAYLRIFLIQNLQRRQNTIYSVVLYFLKCACSSLPTRVIHFFFCRGMFYDHESTARHSIYIYIYILNGIQGNETNLSCGISCGSSIDRRLFARFSRNFILKTCLVKSRIQWVTSWIWVINDAVTRRLSQLI